MEFSQDISHDTTKNEVYKLPCRRCDEKTNHIVLTSVKNTWFGQDIEGRDEYEIVCCRGCDEISFRSSSSNSEDYANHPETGEIIYLEDGMNIAEGTKDELLASCPPFKLMWETMFRTEKRLAVEPEEVVTV